jgi:hypothetical protein
MRDVLDLFISVNKNGKEISIIKMFFLRGVYLENKL